jgi:hypothetical protein
MWLSRRKEYVMARGKMDFEGEGVFLALLSNGELHEVACHVIARGVDYHSWYEDHYGYGQCEYFAEDNLDDFDLHDLEIPYPDEFVYRETKVENEDENLKIVSIEEVIEWEMREIDGSFWDDRDDEPDLDDWWEKQVKL